MGLEVAVIGGGATGCGIARDLAFRGVDVTLFERRGLNAGTSGSNHGVLHSGARYAVTDPDAARRCARENAILREIAPHCLRDTGGWLLARPEDTDYFQAAITACAETGVTASRVDPETVWETDPCVGDIVAAARFGDAVVHPGALTARTAESACRAGATIHTHTPVIELSVESGTVTGIVTEERTHDVDYVVNATGAWAGEVASLAGVDVGMEPTRGVMVVVPQPGVSRICNRARLPSDGDIIVPRGEHVVLGTTSDPVADPSSYPQPRGDAERVQTECAAMVPALSDYDILETYWGVRPLYDGGGRTADRGVTILDHAARDDLGGMTTVVGGKLTTYRYMAERVSDRVCARLGVTASCRTDDEPLPGEEELQTVLKRYDAGGPANFDFA